MTNTSPAIERVKHEQELFNCKNINSGYCGPDEHKKLVLPFCCPANILICGETNCGKTVWLERLLKHQKQLFSPPPSKVLIMYKRYQPTYNRWERTYKNVQCIQGLRKDLLEENTMAAEAAAGFNQNQEDRHRLKTLLILDDFMNETVTDPYFCSLYTAGRHLALCGIITVWHQLFPPGKFQRTISLNMHSYILMRSPR